MRELDFKFLFDDAPSALLVLDIDAPHYTILGVNKAYLRATNTQRDALVGRGLFEAFPDNPQDASATGERNLGASLARVLERKASDSMAVQKYDIARSAADGGGFEERYWSPVNSPVFGADGQLAAILHRVEDVTAFVRAALAGKEASEQTDELRRRNRNMEADILQRSQELDAANQRLRGANLQLSELDKAKTTFFNNISHEFRTPLTLMLGPLEDALQDRVHPLPETQRARVELAHHNSLRLLRLVNALLDFSRVEAGRSRARYAPVQLDQLTSELASMFESVCTRAGLWLRIDCEPLPEPAYVDRDMWERIVLNLISNAFKHTFDGGVRVSVRQDGGAALLTVEDTGVGIPTQELPRIFERFHRVEGHRSRSYEGTGIGLSLVRELARLHGGGVEASSELGAGSAFRVRIPLGKQHLPSDAEIVSAAEAGPSWRGSFFTDEAARWLPQHDADREALLEPTPVDSEATPEAPAKRARVLVVDDNADLRSYLSKLLSPVYTIELATDGAQALASALAEPPDLVVSDAMMPNLDGFGLLRALRAEAKTRDIPFILLSARAGEDNAALGLYAGADDYVAKPFSAHELLARVRTHLELNRARRQWTRELESANRELETFSYSVSHDLRAPLRAIGGFSKALLSDHSSQLDEQGTHYLNRVRAATQRMSLLIDDLLDLSRIHRTPVREEALSLTELVNGIVGELRRRDPGRDVVVDVQSELSAHADRRLLAIALENLLGNAWKFTSKKSAGLISVGKGKVADGSAFFVRDNGAGFDMAYAERLFSPFHRLHKATDFEGTGIGLAIVKRVVSRHGGRIWAQAAPEQGATFYFTLGSNA